MNRANRRHRQITRGRGVRRCDVKIYKLHNKKLPAQIERFLLNLSSA